MKYYEVKVPKNAVITSYLADLLNTAKRVGDIIGDWSFGYNNVHFQAKDINNIEGKLIRNGYDVRQIG